VLTDEEVMQLPPPMEKLKVFSVEEMLKTCHDE
jgi:hypothetical protein